MDDIIKIEILDYWIKYPDKTLELPDYLKNKFNKDDATILFQEVEPSKDSIGGTSTPKSSDFFNHIQKIRSKMKQELEIELIKIQKYVIQKQMDLQSQLNKKYDITNLIMNKERFIMNKQTIIMILQTILTLFLIIATAYIGIRSNNIAEMQTNIIQKQTEILAISSAPIEPTLKIWPQYSPLQLSVTDLLKKQGRRERINICITNLGRINTGSIDIRLQNNWTHNSGIILIDNGLDFGQTNCSWLEVTAYDCWNDPEGCNENKIPIGDINLNLTILCDRCVPNKFNKLFNACIWKDSSRECTI